MPDRFLLKNKSLKYHPPSYKEVKCHGAQGFFLSIFDGGGDSKFSVPDGDEVG